jgi:hypothetical protein
LKLAPTWECSRCAGIQPGHLIKKGGQDEPIRQCVDRSKILRRTP